MSNPQAFTISSEALARFPASLQQTIVDVVQSELEKARSNCLKTLASSYAQLGVQGTQVPIDEAWQREATNFVRSIETYLNGGSNVQRGSSFKPKDSKQILKDAFQRSQFLNKAECKLVAKAAGLSCQQVRTWFQNQRNRSSKKSSSARRTSRTSRSRSNAKSASASTPSLPTPTTSSPQETISATRASLVLRSNLDPLRSSVEAVESDLTQPHLHGRLALPHRVEELGVDTNGASSLLPPVVGLFGYSSVNSCKHSSPDVTQWLEDMSGSQHSSSNPPFLSWTEVPQNMWQTPNATSETVPSHAESHRPTSGSPVFAMCRSDYVEFQTSMDKATFP